MTIEESINGVEKRILPVYDNDADHEALVTAINTMRKYEKIEQILKDIPYGADTTVRRIQKVVEDGNDD